jgi:hypothetical protein
MSNVIQMVYDNGQVRQQVLGDLTLGTERITTVNNAAGQTITGDQILSGIINRTGPTAAYTDTFDSAANIINAILALGYRGTATLSPRGLDAGITFRVKFINSVAFAATIAAGLNVTLGANVNAIAASSVKDLLITVTNGTLPANETGNTVTGSAIIRGMTQDETKDVTVGMVITGTGIPASTTVVSVQSGIGVTMSANATATGNDIALNFSPTVRIDSLGQSLL